MKTNCAVEFWKFKIYHESVSPKSQILYNLTFCRTYRNFRKIVRNEIIDVTLEAKFK